LTHGKATSPTLVHKKPTTTIATAATTTATMPSTSEKTSVSYVIALYDFKAQDAGDLSFRAGDRIQVISRTEPSTDWWTGRLNDRTGIFPSNYVTEEASSSTSAMTIHAPTPPPAYTEIAPPNHLTIASSSSSTTNTSTLSKTNVSPQTQDNPSTFYVVALFDFQAQQPGDLSFRAGDRIQVISHTENQNDWWLGRVHGKEGIFPANYVDRV
jgi:hypothetical protein